MAEVKVTKCPPGNAAGSQDSWPQQVFVDFGFRQMKMPTAHAGNFAPAHLNDVGSKAVTKRGRPKGSKNRG